jgi:PPM family protein phosphatase
MLEHAVVALGRRAEKESEDRVLAIDRGDNGDVVFLAIADGAGGRAGGAAAADAFMDAVRAAVDTMRDLFDVRAWADVLNRVDHQLAEIGETTAIVMAVSTYAIMGVSVGDSEAWLLDCNATPDEIERLTERQSKARLGSSRSRPVPFHRRGLRKDEIVLIATDGLFKHASRNRIFWECQKERKDTEALAATLLHLPTVANRFHPDDVALAVVRSR